MTLKRYVRAIANLTNFIYIFIDISYTSEYSKCGVFNDAGEISLKEYLWPENYIMSLP